MGNEVFRWRMGTAEIRDEDGGWTIFFEPFEKMTNSYQLDSSFGTMKREFSYFDHLPPQKMHYVEFSIAETTAEKAKSLKQGEYERRVFVVAGYPTEMALMEVSLQDNDSILDVSAVFGRVCSFDASVTVSPEDAEKIKKHDLSDPSNYMLNISLRD